MNRKTEMKNFIGGALCLLALNVNSALIEQDWQLANDKHFTLDTASGL